jgi:hypothetical protein
MRLLSMLGESSGMASVMTVAVAATLANIMVRNLVSCILAMMKSIMTPAQKSKLIICFMTKTPMPIHMAQPANIMRPRSAVKSSSM